VKQKTLRFFFALAPILLLASCSSCRGAAGEHSLTILSYNVENLFDDVDNGTEYREFDPGLGTWGTTEYHARLASVAEVLKSCGGPDIAALQEVENEKVLAALSETYAKDLSYRHLALVEAPGSAVNTGLLSRYPITAVKSHRVQVGRRDLGRYIMEVRVFVEGIPLVVFNNHWKSKVDGAEETEPLRIAAAALLTERIAELLAFEPSLDIVVLGDLNEGVGDYEAAGGSYRTALLPLSAEPSGGADWPCILVTGNPAESSVKKGRLVLFSPWSRGEGSYVYRGRWLAIDHSLLAPSLFDGKGFSFQDFSVFKAPFLLDEDGFPRSHVKGSGYSDHLPILLTLSKAQRNSP